MSGLQIVSIHNKFACACGPRKNWSMQVRCTTVFMITWHVGDVTIPVIYFTSKMFLSNFLLLVIVRSSGSLNVQRVACGPRRKQVNVGKVHVIKVINEKL